ncbi:MAG: DUF354 domain-containing protein [Candidatus Zapsychrus exili]|nr:DUF354 domain-containing protein [Candidatus Zapsychrus exili]
MTEYINMEMNPPTKKILFFLNHPAHYHLFKNVIINLKRQKYDISIVIVKKDILEDLLLEEGWEYTNIFPEGRRSKRMPHYLALAVYLIKTWFRLFKYLKKNKADLMIGSERSIVHVGAVMGIPSLYVCEDDTVATPENYITYPFATKVIIPNCCDLKLWKNKKITYEGYHELAYLHPRYFTPDKQIVEQFNPEGTRYFVLRLVEFSASHDKGKKGISDDLARQIIDKLKGYGKVFITSERPLLEEFEQYRLNVNPKDIFHVLSFADLFIGDSQTMTLEAAILGTPAIRFNDFVGIHSVFKKLEDMYGLLFDISPSKPQELLSKIDELLKNDNLKSQWRNKKKILLVETIDVASFITEVIKYYTVKN